jgi:AbiV family abortive infection protein
MAKSGSIPSHRELAALGQASLVHAREQLADAELLLEHGRWPLAHAVVALALEEVGKAHLCFTCMIMPAQFRAGNWFWPAFNSHTAKLMIAQFILQMSPRRRPRLLRSWKRSRSSERWPVPITPQRCVASTSTTRTALFSIQPTSPSRQPAHGQQRQHLLGVHGAARRQ